MDAISYTFARQNLAKTMDKVVENQDTVIITRQNAGAVVMMSLEEFNSWQETSHLLSNPINAAKLRESIADVEAGKTKQVSLDSLEKL